MKKDEEIVEVNAHGKLSKAQDNKDTAEDLIYEFLKDKGKLTAKAYQRDLKAFFDFTNEYFQLPRRDGAQFLFGEIRRVHIVKYKNYLEQLSSNRNKPYAPNTINRRLSTVSSFFQFLEEREIIDKNPVELRVRSTFTCAIF